MELGAPSPYLLGSLPNQLFLLSDVRSGSIAKAMLSVASLFPYSHPHSAWGVSGTRKTTGTLYILSMQERLTLHVRILVHISQVSSVFLKSQCQCSCTDILTKILTTCRCGKCFWRCWCEEPSIVG